MFLASKEINHGYFFFGGGADVPYDLTPEFLEELFTKHHIDYVVHGDDPCLLPDGTDAYATAKKKGRFRMVRPSQLT